VNIVILLVRNGKVLCVTELISVEEVPLATRSEKDRKLILDYLLFSHVFIQSDAIFTTVSVREIRNGLHAVCMELAHIFAAPKTLNTHTLYAELKQFCTQ
jgi:hypothetical protein